MVFVASSYVLVSSLPLPTMELFPHWVAYRVRGSVLFLLPPVSRWMLPLRSMLMGCVPLPETDQLPLHPIVRIVPPGYQHAMTVVIVLSV